MNTGIDAELRPQQSVGLRIFRTNDRIDETALLLRIDTPVKVDYSRRGGILPMYCGTCWLRWMASGECIGAATKRQTRAGDTPHHPDRRRIGGARRPVTTV